MSGHHFEVDPDGRRRVLGVSDDDTVQEATLAAEANQADDYADNDAPAPVKRLRSPAIDSEQRLHDVDNVFGFAASAVDRALVESYEFDRAEWIDRAVAILYELEREWQNKGSFAGFAWKFLPLRLTSLVRGEAGGNVLVSGLEIEANENESEVAGTDLEGYAAYETANHSEQPIVGPDDEDDPNSYDPLDGVLDELDASPRETARVAGGRVRFDARIEIDKRPHHTALAGELRERFHHLLILSEAPSNYWRADRASRPHGRQPSLRGSLLARRDPRDKRPPIPLAERLKVSTLIGKKETPLALVYQTLQAKLEHPGNADKVEQVSGLGGWCRTAESLVAEVKWRKGHDKRPQGDKQRPCEECGDLHSRRADARFCGGKCRNDNWKRKPRKQAARKTDTGSDCAIQYGGAIDGSSSATGPPPTPASSTAQSAPPSAPSRLQRSAAPSLRSPVARSDP